MAASSVIRDFVCTACGCACDDLAVTVDAGRIAAIQPPCPLAERLLLAERPDDAAGDGSAAIANAAGILRAARAPLVMGFERATVEAQRFAVEIAARLGGFLDPTDDRGASRSHAALQTVGAVTATLGEVAQRADLVLYWNCDPATTHPRHIERFASRAGQRRIAVSHWPSPTAALADDFLLIPADAGLDSLRALRALVRGVALDAEQVEQQTGSSLDSWRRLAVQLQAARYAAIFYDSPSSPAGDANAQTIVELVRDLHRRTRAVALPLGAAWNAVGAAQTLAWHTGFPSAIHFARGYPQHLPGEADAAVLLARGEVDAALIVAADPLPHLPPAAAAHLRAIPTIVLDDRDTATMRAATVALRIAAFGVETAGTTFRSDGVALPLRPAAAPTAPTAEASLAQLAALLTCDVAAAGAD